MGLFQKAVETYDAHSDYVGKEREGHQMLAPIGHIITRADLEITLEQNGQFSSARLVGKDEPEIPIPATEESAGRTSGICAHPLCDKLCYLAPYDKKKHTFYVNQLEAWESSKYSHLMLSPILVYIKNGTILQDLVQMGLVSLNEKGIPKQEGQLVRWRVHGIGTPRDGCWQQQSLFQAFQNWYSSLQDADRKEFCFVTGEFGTPAKQHSKRIIPSQSNAKLISSNDEKGFTYRGRFTEESQAATVSYIASQKAHNALRWLAEEQGVQAVFGGRTFLCWNPQGIQVCHAFGPFGNPANTSTEPSEYRRQLKHTLQGYCSTLPEKNSGVVIAAFDAATTGRLAVTYYNELSGSDYLDRLHDWDVHCCWYRYNGRIQSPPLWQIVNCAFGTQIKEKDSAKIKADFTVMGQHIQRLIACRIDKNPIPKDILYNLVQRASNPLAYESNVWKIILSTACAVIQKYRYDRYKEECDMKLNSEKADRSYQFGRLLAVFEKVERDTYTNTEESREPNAMRMQYMFSRRPLYVAGEIEKQLEQAYFPRLKIGSRSYYKKLIGEIMEQIHSTPKAQWNAPLKETYLMGYYLQRNELYRSKKDNETENEN